MSGKAGEIVVCDVLGHELPRRIALLFNSYGTKSGGCNVFVQVQADRWRVGYVWLKSAIRECADGVCAENSHRCWLVLVAASGRTIRRVAEGNCRGAAGREKGSTMWIIVL